MLSGWINVEFNGKNESAAKHLASKSKNKIKRTFLISYFSIILVFILEILLVS